MKIEPKQSAKRPHYAAALAAIASAAVLTGCQACRVEIEGGSPVPIYEDDADTAEQIAPRSDRTGVQI